MTTEDTQTSAQPTETTQPKDISDPNISFAEYTRLRRGESLPEVESKQSAPASVNAPAEQNQDAQESETSGKEDVKSEKEEETQDDQPKEGEDPGEAKDKPAKGKNLNKRFGKLTAQKAAAEARALAAEQELAVMRERLALRGAGEKPAPTESKTAAAEGKPNPESFTTHAEYVEALTEWKTEQKLIERDRKAEQNRLQDEQSKLVQTYSDRAKAFSEKHEDFDDLVAENLSDVPKNPAIEQVILSTENGPELLYELAKNPTEAKRIALLTPSLAIMEMGRLQERIASRSSQAAKPEPKKLTQAPKPIEPVSGTQSKTVKSIDDPDISFADYVRLRRQQMKRRGA